MTRSALKRRSGWPNLMGEAAGHCVSQDDVLCNPRWPRREVLVGLRQAEAGRRATDVTEDETSKVWRRQWRIVVSPTMIDRVTTTVDMKEALV